MDWTDPRWQRRQERWRHNSYLGHCAMAAQNMRTIAKASTTTDESRLLAEQIEGLLDQLAASLKTRKESSHG